MRALYIIFLSLLVCADVRHEAFASRSVFYVDGLAVDMLENEADRDGLVMTPPVMELNRELSGSLSRPRPTEEGAITGAPRSPKLREHLRAADQYFRLQKWMEARAELEQAYEMNPRNVAILKRGAIAFSLASEYAIAENYFRRYMAEKPDDIQVMGGWAAVLIRLKYFEDARKILEKAMALDSKNLLAQFNLAVLDLAEQKKIERAGQWRALRAESVELVANWLHADQSSLEPVITPYKYEKLCDAVLGEGTYQSLKEVVDAFRVMRQAYDRKNWSAAEKALLRLKSMGVESFGLDFLLIKSYLSLGSSAKALEVASNTARANPKDSSVWYNFGSLLLGHSKPAEAVQAFETAAAIDPEWPAARFGIACSKAADGKLGEAWPILIALANEDPVSLESWLQIKEPFIEIFKSHPQFGELQELLQP